MELGEHASVPPIIWCDNMSALALAANPVYHARTKHVEIDYHFIREKVLSKQIQVQHVGTQDQVADIFTKSLCAACFLLLKDKLMVVDTQMSLQGHVS